MAIPATKAQLLSYCKRQLGAPVVEINVDDDQADDILDDAIQFFQEYHYYTIYPCNLGKQSTRNFDGTRFYGLSFR